MVGGKDVFRESEDAIQESLNHVNSWKVNLAGAVKVARSSVKLDWEQEARVNVGKKGWSRPSVEQQESKIAARNWGKEVSDLLSWYTTEKDQRRITELINSLKPSNVMHFIEWYNDNRLGWGLQDGFFWQLYKEYGFKNKMSLIKRVGNLVVAFADGKNFKQTANKIRNICSKGELKGDDITNLWKCVFDIKNVVGLN